MKTEKHIFERTISMQNITAAIYRAAEDKKDRKEVQEVLADVEKHAYQIHKMLVTGTYKPCPYKESFIREGAGQKQRKVTKIDFYPDQIIHWALVLQLQPVIEKGAYAYSCGSMPGRGPHFGKPKLEKWIRKDRKNTKYSAKLDITKFYESVTHTLAKASIRTIIKDPKMLWLLDTIIDSYPKGLPIGYLTSQWLANFILQKLDHLIKQVLKIKYYMRYMDDMILFGPNKRKLHKAVRMIMGYLEKMNLKIKKNWQVFKLDARALDFMGFRFFRHKTILRKSLMLRITRKAKRIYNKGKATFKDAAAIISYLGWIKHSQTYKVFKTRVVPYVSIKAMKAIIRQYSRGEISRNENIPLRKHRTAIAS